MTFIILDLEWNGAYSKRFKRFINEIIEFGAVKIDEKFHVLDTFEALIRPQIGKKISGKIKTLTSLTNEDLAEGSQFLQVSSRFRKWAGNSVLMTWGTSDILVLTENCRYFYGSRQIPFLSQYVDLQLYCEHMLKYGSAKQMGLSTAAQLLHINESEFDHHRALGDSLLALMCFQKVYKAETLKQFICNARTEEFYNRIEFKTTIIKDLNHPLIQPGDLSFDCDICGSSAYRIGEWQLKNKSFFAEFLCRSCRHKFYGRVRFKLKYDGMTVKKAILQINAEEDKTNNALNEKTL